jgi:hypothetical protein
MRKHLIPLFFFCACATSQMSADAEPHPLNNCLVSYSIDWNGVPPPLRSSAILFPKFHLHEEQLKQDPDLVLFSASDALFLVWPKTEPTARSMYLRFARNCDKKEEMVRALINAYHADGINAKFSRIEDLRPGEHFPENTINLR